jgi:hypothetical protein
MASAAETIKRNWRRFLRKRRGLMAIGFKLPVYNRMPDDSAWWIEYGECLFWSDAGERESSGRRYTDAGPGNFYRDFSPSGNKCMQKVAVVLTMLHKPTGTRESLSAGPDDAGSGNCWVTPEYEVSPRRILSKDQLDLTRIGVPRVVALPS